jgi:hypothetical protein
MECTKKEEKNTDEYMEKEKNLSLHYILIMEN